MDRLIEKNKTYRIPKKDGSTDLIQVLLILGDSIKVKDLKKNIIKILKKSTFEKDLDEGRIYVSAENRRERIISALKKIISRS
jgi:hypothetical protein